MLKPFHQITVPDERHRWFSHPETLEPITLELHYQDVERITLSEAVPPDVVEAFDRSRNAFVYAWFVYELLALAHMQAYASLELALRKRFGIPSGKNAPSLSRLLQRAVTEKLVVDPQAHHKGGIASFVSSIRNMWGHGTNTLLDPGQTIDALRMTANIINRLFSDEAAGPSRGFTGSPGPGH